jgi:hypothetical protein
VCRVPVPVLGPSVTKWASTRPCKLFRRTDLTSADLVSGFGSKAMTRSPALAR